MTTQLTHRERILRAIEYQDVDRMPTCFRAEPLVIDLLKKEFNLKDELDIIRYFDADAVHAVIKYKPDYKLPEKVFSEDATVEDIERHPWSAKDAIDIEKSIQEAEEKRRTGLAVYGGAWASLFTNSRRLMGEENFLISTIAKPDVVTRLVERLADHYLETNEIYFSKCAKDIDIFYMGSDFGTQISLFISRDMFVQFFKPHFKRLTNHAKGFGLKVMFHTCGAVSGLIPDLIDCGIDILDPVQASATGMAPSDLAGPFKGKIVFHGGISTQTTLPFGKPADVRNDVIHAIRTLGRTGYIPCPDQNIVENTPVENITTMFRTITEYRA
ncbi:MAG: hypothetical protein A3K19_09190 [Lentisphaerae bacterium RIFOXYB12_FULL_65_16]|nr:MAG: hypothetical protein A3K18_14690 [Lentisphaerae bacterium RIFOXYA12_64_32]OGV90360.1 MAG: hypothetical protein A3K19_09190 [Lentisphaerae bacterium RIFOXYB12_FULL_65_16]